MGTRITDIDGITRAPADKLRRAGIVTIADLAASTPDAVRAAIKGSGGRITVADSERWVAEARAIEAEWWHRAASFVVSFESRVEAEHERRTVVQQTELDVEPPPQDWPGWDCSELCDWMRKLLEPAPDSADLDAEPDADPPAARPARPPRVERAHRITQATLVGATGQRHTVLEGGAVTTASGTTWSPWRLLLVVDPAPGGPALAAARFRETTTATRLWAGPVELPEGSGPVELDLPAIPAGDHDVVIVLWDEDARAEPASVAASFSLAVGSPEPP